MSPRRIRLRERALVRVCAYCDAVRIVWPDGTERWTPRRGGLPPEEELSHGICPRCFEAVMAGLGARLRRHGKAAHSGFVR